MKRNIYKSPAHARKALLTFASTALLGTAYAQTTYTLGYTGSVQTLTLAAGSYSVQAWGADGGPATNGTGGKGGYSAGTLTVGTAATYYIYVGGKGSNANVPTTGGWNGGGNLTGTFSSPNNGGTGGGGTDIRTTMNTTYANRIIVAGGGGGATGYGAYTGNGGNGGGTTGANGASSRGATYAGGGGTQSAGGTSATGGIPSYSMPGALGTGGDYVGTLGGTAGGGGYYGGGSGHWGGSSGGGSGYIGGVTSGTTAQVAQPGFVANPDASGNGFVTITSLCSATVTAAASSNTVCDGSSLTLNATSTTATSYTWSPAGGNAATATVTPSSNTVYTVTASDGSCATQATLAVNVLASPTVAATASRTLICANESAVLTASASATSYTWSANAGSATTMSTTVTPSATTVYTVTVSNGTCTAQTIVVVSVNPCTGIEEMASAGDIVVYPNPTHGLLNIAIMNESLNSLSIEVFDALGKQVLKETLTKASSSFNLNRLEDGVYFYKIIHNNSQYVKVGKLIKQ